MHTYVWSRLVVITSLCGGLQSVSARQCTNGDFVGPYSFLGLGQVLQAPPDKPIVGPFVRLGRLVSLGDGTLLAGYSTASYSGTAYTKGFAGAYRVNPDCSVDFLLEAPTPVEMVVPFSGLLSYDNTEVRMVTTAPGGLVSGTVIRQTTVLCSPEDFKGLFQFELSGSLLPPFPLPGPFLRLGRLSADGEGGFTAAVLTTYAGLTVPEEISGTYTIDLECKFVLSHTVTGPEVSRPERIEGVLFHRKSAQVIVTTPGFAVGGTLRNTSK